MSISAQARLESLLLQAQHHAPQEVILGLERTRRILMRLGHPEQALACIHVAGTNGKGSVIAFLTAILEQAGIEPGVYTSPHLERFNERIRIGSAPLEEALLIPLLERVLAACAGESATFFEITTALAFLAFSQAAPPWTLLETGLGGRLDATNVVTPRLCILTSVGLDHQAYLGDTLARIAAEKCGILKPGVPLVCDPVEPEATAVVVEQARRLGVPCALRGEAYDFTLAADGSWRYQDEQGALWLPPPGLPGRHQYANAALAVQAARRLAPVPLPPPLLAAAMTTVRWPGRLERFPGRPTFWLDGAHNPAAVRVLAQALQDLGLAPVHLLFSALADKDAAAMVALLAPWVAEVAVVAVGGARAREVTELATLWHDLGRSVHPLASPDDALAWARRHAPAEGNVVVAGSLYLVGAVRTLLK